MTRKRTVILAGAAFLLGSLFYIFTTGCTHRHTRQKLAQIQVEIVGAAVDQYRADLGKYPADLEQLLESIESEPKWLGPYARKPNLIDPWDRSLYYRVENDGRSFVLFSLGKDGRLGGDDADADVSVVGCEDCNSH